MILMILKWGGCSISTALSLGEVLSLWWSLLSLLASFFHTRLQYISQGIWSSLNVITKCCAISVKLRGIFSKWDLWSRISGSKYFCNPKSFTRNARTKWSSLETPYECVTQNWKFIFHHHHTCVCYLSNCMTLNILWKVNSFKSGLGYDSSKRLL